MKLIAMPIRDFALPVPRTGSIEAHSGYGRATTEGQEIHLRVQKERTEADPTYRSEVSLTQDFEREGFLFRIGGRMDGFFDSDPKRIEEIKSTFNIHELSRRLSDRPHDHPYCLQLKTYGYLYWLQNQAVPDLSFHLVSSSILREISDFWAETEAP